MLSVQGLNSTWFVPEPAQQALRGSRMHAIYAVSWERQRDSVKYPLIWTENKTVDAYDVSEYYIEASKLIQPAADIAVAHAL